MTLPNPADAPLLLTDADVLQRVEQLVGPAAAARQLWIMFVDGDGRQSPVIVPISDIPLRPELRVIDDLAAGLRDLCAQLSTEVGGGSVVFTLERLGRDAVLAGDRQWAAALEQACHRAGASLRGVYLSTSGGVHRIPPP
ncbi:hypothetical protein ACU61A_10015 [Pseudonocardia sichuanensis]